MEEADETGIECRDGEPHYIQRNGSCSQGCHQRKEGIFGDEQAENGEEKAANKVEQPSFRIGSCLPCILRKTYSPLSTI